MTARTRLVVFVLTLALVALVPVAPAVAREPRSDRLGGADRFETAALIAADGFPAARNVVLVSGRNFPDATAAAGLAGALDGPILLTEPGGSQGGTSPPLGPDALPAATARALATLGAITVHIVGGTEAVSQAVEDELAATYEVVRHGGGDRYATAALLARELDGVIADLNGLRTAIVATGEAFPDALTAGPLAFAGPHPLLLVRQGTVPAATRDALVDLGIEQVVLLGGQAAVNTTVEAELAAIVGNPVLRLGGSNRFATAALVADLAWSEFAFATGGTVLAANGLRFPDALAGGPLGGMIPAPILLTSDGALPAATATWLAGNAERVGRVRALGGPAAVAEASLSAAIEAATTDPSTYTVELSWINETNGEGGFFFGEEGATGTAELTFDEAAGTIAYDLTVDVAGTFDGAPGAHLHAGTVLENGPIVVTFATAEELTAGGGQVSGTVSEADFTSDYGELTVAEIVADIERYYVNVHTTDHPAGAVRGQLPFGGQDEVLELSTMVVPLSWINEISPDGAPFAGEEGSFGVAVLELRAGVGEIAYLLLGAVDSPFSGAPGAHLHAGALLENGPIVVTLATAEELEAGEGLVEGVVTEDDFTAEFADLTVAEIQAAPEGFYVNVHTSAFPGGAVRGQLPDGGQVELLANRPLEVELSWINETDGQGNYQLGEEGASGTATLTFDPDAGTIAYAITVAADGTFAGAAGAHLHAGGIGEAGPIVVGFATGAQLQEGNGTVSGVVTEAGFTAAFAGLTVEDILADIESYYVNVHTVEHPAGAVRGQLPRGGQGQVPV